MFKNILQKLAGNPYEREIARYTELVQQVADLEPAMQALSDEELRELTEHFRQRVQAYTADIEDKDLYIEALQEILDDLMPEAFAAVREASIRTIGLRHYDVQIIGGIVLHEGKIAEMRTGEGKTLVASLPLYLNALAGRGAHLVTVNDYLARRDGGWMGPIYTALGMTVGVIGKERFSAIFDPDYVDPGGDLEDERLVHWRPTLRQDCYMADITYGTSSEFGFDYLRDNTTTDRERLVQGIHAYVIVDEVDSVLIDGARTPLIISGPANKASKQYVRFADILSKARLRRNTTDLENDEEPDGDYVIDDRTRSISLTEPGIEKVERQLDEIDSDAGQSVYDPQFYELVHYLDNALKAKFIFKRDVDYIVQQGSIVLIDQTTGRPMPSRRYSEGLHQAIEAKEGVTVRREDRTIATITVQNYFRLYDKISGMTGTAVTQAEEFDEVYTLDVIAIPTNVEFRADNDEFEVQTDKEEGAPVITYWDYEESEEYPAFFKRIDYPDQVYLSMDGKFEAAAREIVELSQSGRPILVGTGSVEASEILSSKLKKLKMDHEILNAKNHDREALIVAQAGRQGSITISTSMAGRGTDILLGGNPEGLAAKYMAEQCFSVKDLTDIVASVVKDDLETGRKKVRVIELMHDDTSVVEWIVQANNELLRKANVDDIAGAVINDIREMSIYQDIPFEMTTQLVRQIDLTSIDSRRLSRARQLVAENDLPTSLIPEIQFLLNEYRSMSGLMGQAGQVDVLTQRLYEQHYNARAALVRAVLSEDLDEAHQIIEQTPALPESFIGDIQAIVQDCLAARRRVWELGGLHVIGTERHESRRIDDQLRGRAARQGDPGSSRFYLSLEDELMLRFGGERTKRVMERLNVPEDQAIAANILSNIIEQAQAKFEAYHFDIRKNLVEYDEAVNRQRQIVYDERNAILRGDGTDLDQMVRQFLRETLERAIERTMFDYEVWAMSEIQNVIDDYSNFETGEVNTRGVVRRVLSLFPRPADDELQGLLSLTDSEDLLEELRAYVQDGIDEGYHIRMLHADIARMLPIWPVLPPFTQRGVEGWEPFIQQVKLTFEHYTNELDENDRNELWNELNAELSHLFQKQMARTKQGDNLNEVQNELYAGLNDALNNIFREIIYTFEFEDDEEIDESSIDDLTNIILERFDYLLEISKLSPEEIQSNAYSDNDAGWLLDQKTFAIGQEELDNYERALMLTVIDEEWRQYLTAIDDLRQGAGLAAVGQRDPKVEFKRKAFDMFEQLRMDVQAEIARRFFQEMSRHRQVVEQQRQQDALLDQLAQQGYRVKQHVSRSGGQVKVARTIEKDMWSNVGRNDLCPCGSGKKFKDCHYQQIRQQQQTVSQEVATSGRSGRSNKRRRRRR